MFKKFLTLFTLTALTLSACGDADSSDSAELPQLPEPEPIKIVTTFPPLYSFASSIVGDQGEVTNLVEPGTSVHIWEPSPSDLQALSEADLLVMNGLELEPFINDMIDAAQNPDLEIVITAEAISDQIMESDAMLELDHEHEDEDHDEDEVEHEHEEGHEEEEDQDHEEEAEDHDHEGGHENEEDHEHEEDEEEHHHHHGGQDPHIWLNPELAMAQVESIRDVILKIDPSHASVYNLNTENYLNTLRDLDQELEGLLQSVNQKPFIVFHDAYLYYFDRYGLLESRKAAIEPFPGKEPTANYFQELVELIEEEGVEIVFTEPQFNPQVVQNLQEETGINAFEIDPIGLELSPEGYENNLRTLTETFVSAFQ